MSYREPHLLSRPVRVDWMGWQSDTLELQRCGWSISAEQDQLNRSMRIAMKHPDYGYGMSASVRWDYYSLSDRFAELPTLPMQIMGRDVQIHMHGAIDFSSFETIDAMPQLREVRSLNDLVHFAPSLVRTKEIIVPEESVNDLMGRIIEMQQPARIERIQRDIRDDVIGKPRQKFHAQILSLAA